MAQRSPKKRPTPQLVSLSKDTLDQILPELRGVGTELRIQGAQLDGLYSTLSSMTTETAERAKDAARNAKLESGKDRSLFQKLFRLNKSESPKEDTTIRGGISRGVEKGIGGGLGLFTKLAGGGAGIAALGVGIAGFLTAMAGADAAARKLGTGKHLAALLGNIADGLSNFNLTNGAQLAALLGTGALFGAVSGVQIAGRAAVGMGAIGLGIAGFISGFMLPLAGLNWLGLDYERMPEIAKAVGDTLTAFAGSLSESTAIALGGLLGVSALFGRFKGFAGIAILGRAALGMTAMGAGLGGFVAGIAATSGIAAFLGFDGEGFATIATNIAKGLNAFDGDKLKLLSPLFAAGALFGAVGGARGIIAAGFASVGATLFGFGLGGFISGFAAAGGIAGWMGVTGEGMRDIMINIAAGLEAFNGVDGRNFVDLGVGITGLGVGLGAFLLALGANKVANGITNLSRFLAAKITGTDYESADKSIAEKLIAEINPFKDIDPRALENINSLNGERFKTNMKGIADGLGAFTSYQFKTALKGVGISILNFFSGRSKENERTMIDQIKEIGDEAQNLEKGASALELVAAALGKFSSININSRNFDIKKVLTNLSKSIPLLEGLTGGDKAITADHGGFLGLGKISFGEGLINNKNIDLPGISRALEELGYVIDTPAMRNRSTNNLQVSNFAQDAAGYGGMVVKGGDYVTGGKTFVTNNYVTHNHATKVPANKTLVSTGLA